MERYKLTGAPDTRDDDLLIYATHPAPSGTYIVYAQKDGSSDRAPVLLWGVLDDGSIVPLTISGVWDGVINQNSFVLHPDGSCEKFQNKWQNIEKAIAELKQYAD